MENPSSDLYGRLMDIELNTGNSLTLRADVRNPKYSGRSGTLENLFGLNAMLDPKTLQLTGWLTTEDKTCTLEGSLEALPEKDRTNGAHNAYTVILREDGKITATATLKLNEQKGILWSLLLGDLEVNIENIRVTRTAQLGDNSLSALFTVYENGVTVDTINIGLSRSNTQDGYTRWDAAFEDVRGQVDLGILCRKSDDGIGFGADCTLTQAGGEARQLIDFLFELNEAAADFAPIGGTVHDISGELAENLWKQIGEKLK